MSRTIVLSKRASKRLDKLLDYLESKWSKRVKDNFIIKLDRSLNILKEKPESTIRSEIIHGLHKCVVTKQTTVFYKFDDKHVYVVTIFDTRQDPGKLKEETGK